MRRDGDDLTVNCRDGRAYRLPVAAAAAALLVIDMQRDFCCGGGYCSAAGCDVAPVRAIIPAVQSVLAFARARGMTIVHTREGHMPDLSDLSPAKRLRSRHAGAEIGTLGPIGKFLVRGEPGHDFIAELTPQQGEVVIDKPGYGAFYATALEHVLRCRGVTHLLITGVTTEVCVSSTTREAADRGFYNLLLEDCCAAYDKTLHDAAVRMVETEGGIFGWVATSRSLLDGACAAQPRSSVANV